ncbi:hypothetical protein [Mycobacterium sp.]|uniref:hypothetical protein n=1 Tax=Mycobacterium sp. TaxID=1785 RepID=UPI0025D83109|nr:hypothetical protein [Mycobacterium sp.]
MRTPHLLAGACAIDPADRVRRAELAVWDELTGSLVAHPGQWRSLEEGAMVLGEEVDELWEDVRRNQLGHARAEAAQVGAMAIRFVADLYEPPGPALERFRAAAAAVGAARESVGPRGRLLASGHEGFGFVKREYDALWTAVRFDDPGRGAGLRVAAAAVRFIAEITSTPTVVRSAT